MPQFPVYNSGAFICSSFLALFSVLHSLFVLFASFSVLFCSCFTFSVPFCFRPHCMLNGAGWWIAECGKCVYQLCRQLRVACIFKWFKRKPIYQWLNTTSRNPGASNSCCSCSRRSQLKGERERGERGCLQATTWHEHGTEQAAGQTRVESACIKPK